MESSYLKKLEMIEKRFRELENFLSDSKILSNQQEFKKLSKERSDYVEVMESYEQFKKVSSEIVTNTELLNEGDPEIQNLAKAEILSLEPEKDRLEKILKVLLLPKDPNDEKNIIIEIRAGTGGDEASLFAADLFRMYQKYSERKGWVIEILSTSVSDVKGFKEIILMVSGQRVYSHLKYESGVHRVQRVPKTEAMGRIHTSAVTVAVLPEADEIEIDVKTEDIKVDVFRSSGPGGQSVNTTDSAVRLTHIPSGMVISCQDEKSQHKNKAKALKILRARLFDFEQQKQAQKIAETRKSQVGSGDRSEKIRTYNFPQARVTDHRIGLTLYTLETVMNGHIEEIIAPLQNHFQQLSLVEETK